MAQKVKILKVGAVTHDVRRFVVEKPEGFSFVPGQACEVSINKPGIENEKRPFTFTSLNDDDFLEFTIKIYSEHKGFTSELQKLKPGDSIVLNDVIGTIRYKGSGVFIAGGAGITPFIAIFRQLKKEGSLEGNSLIFSNKTARDVILEKELKAMFKGKNLTLILTEEKRPGYAHGRIDRQFLRSKIRDFSRHFYVCGPPKMVEDIKNALLELGAKPDSLVFEGKG